MRFSAFLGPPGGSRESLFLSRHTYFPFQVLGLMAAATTYSAHAKLAEAHILKGNQAVQVLGSVPGRLHPWDSKTPYFLIPAKQPWPLLFWLVLGCLSGSPLGRCVLLQINILQSPVLATHIGARLCGRALWLPATCIPLGLWLLLQCWIDPPGGGGGGGGRFPLSEPVCSLQGSCKGSQPCWLQFQP